MTQNEKIIYKQYQNLLKASPIEEIPMGRMASIEVLAKYYDCFCFDGFGTLYLRDSIYPDSIEALEYLRKLGKPIRLVSNTAARTGAELHQDLQEKGLEFALTEILTSGDLLRQINLKLNIESAFLFGKESSYTIFHQAGIEVSKKPRQNVVIVTSQPTNQDEGQEWLFQAQNILNQPNSMLIVANPDVCAPEEDLSKTPVSGTWANQLLANHKGKTLYIGKPFPLIFTHAMQSFFPHLGSILMVGDTLGTDILGAYHSGIDSALLLRGNTQMENLILDTEHLNLKPTYVLENLSVSQTD